VNPLTHVQRGDRRVITASNWNSMVDAARHMRDHAHDRDRAVPADSRIGGTVVVRNGTASVRPRFAALAVTGSLFDPPERPVLTTAVAVSSSRAAAVLQVPLAPGAIGPAVVHGVTWCRINVPGGAGAWHFVELATGSDRLVLAQEGQAEVLWRESGTGNKMALIRVSIRRDD
jgi:hypothetical protein